MAALRIAIIGNGRMGRAVATLAEERGHMVTAVLGRAANEGGRAIASGALGNAEVAIEFTEPAAAAANALACVRAGVPVVVGTTGWYERLDEVVAAVRAARGALLYAPNFSPGVTLFLELARRAGRLFDDHSLFDAHIIETHHVAKKDAPSGTAQALARAFARDDASRAPAITSVRTGHVPGTHELVLDGPFEQVRLTHIARDRRVFADGALRAAEWLRGRSGVFTMRDVLGLEPEIEQ